MLIADLVEVEDDPKVEPSAPGSRPSQKYKRPARNDDIRKVLEWLGYFRTTKAKDNGSLISS